MISHLKWSRTGWSRINRIGAKPMAVKGPRRTSMRWVGGSTRGWERRADWSGLYGYMAKGASPELYRSLTLKFKETDNSFPFRPASVLQYHIPFLSFHCLVKPALIIKDCYPGSYAQREGKERERKRKDTTGREKERVQGAWLGKVFPTSVLHHPDSRPIMLRWKVRRILREFNIPHTTAPLYRLCYTRCHSAACCLVYLI